MLRVSHVSLKENCGLLALCMHHIASDGWSIEVLTKDFFKIYNAFYQGNINPLPNLKIQYVDYANWQRKNLGGALLSSKLAYWKEQLKNAPTQHSLPLSGPRPKFKNYQGAVVTGQLLGETVSGLRVFARKHKLTSFILLHGALALLLSRHSNNNDIVLGTPVANRLQEEIEPLVGFFANMLVLRTKTEHQTVADYFAHVKKVNLDAQANQDVPFEQLVDTLKLPRSTAYAPLFQVMLTTNTDYGLRDVQENEFYQLPGISIKSRKIGITQAKFDLDVNIHVDEQGIRLQWVYDTNLFSKTYIETLNSHLIELFRGLSEVTEADKVHLSQLPMLSLIERSHLLYGLNDNGKEYPKSQCIHQLFEDQVAKDPNAVAVVFEDQQLTYGELNKRANQLAHYLLKERAVQPDSLVGLCLDRSVEVMIGILGILKAGSAYVPLDPEYPAARLAYMIDDTQLSTIVTSRYLLDCISINKHLAVCLDESVLRKKLAEQSDENLFAEHLGLTSNHLAYVIYTSGSTGDPKGVLIEHASVTNLWSALYDTVYKSLSSPLRVAVNAGFSFDASVKMWVQLLSGASLLIVPQAVRLDGASFMEWLQECRVDVLDSTPMQLELLLAQNLLKTEEHCPQAVLVGGDEIPADTWEKLRNCERIQFFNVYGPTECTVDATVAQVEESCPTPSIGRPLANTPVYIVNQYLQPVPMGVTGELLIGGVQVARGYLNQPDLSAEKFIPNPFDVQDWAVVGVFIRPEIWRVGCRMEI